MSHFNQDFNVIYIRVVQGCNLNCAHCFTLGNQDEVKLAPLEQIQKYLQSIKTHVNPRKATFYIHGGETFLAPKVYLAEVNDIIRDVFKGTEFNIIPQTNLMYKVDQAYADFIHKEYNSQLGVSWDEKIRFSTTTGALNENLFLNNFKFLAQSGIEMAVAVTVQNHLLKVPPLEFVKKFDGATSLDFEFLTTFDEKTRNLKVRNEEWSQFFSEVVKYYATHDVTWSMPHVDLFTKSFRENTIYQCKCNCCEHRTFTMNVNGTVGLCPDDTYIHPLSTVDQMSKDWSTFAEKARQKYILQKCQELPPICMSCEFFDICGGNCESSLFNENEKDCPMSHLALRYQLSHLDVFEKKLKKAKENLIELHTTRPEPG